MNLQEFLNNNVVEGLTAEVALSDRFKDENGELMKFKIRAVTQKGLEDLRKRATFVDKSGKKSLNDSALSSLLVIENTINPNFKDAKSLEKLNCATPVQYLNKVLLAGEIEGLATEILNASGFGKTINELMEEVKNF